MSDVFNGNYDVFISYRRESGSEVARLIREKLVASKWRVFLDVTDLGRGPFDEALLAWIAATPSFIVILSVNALDRCIEEQDWLRQEIAQAIKTRRNIISILIPGFKFPAELPPDIKDLPRHPGLEYSNPWFEAMIAKIVENMEAEKAGAAEAQLASVVRRLRDANRMAGVNQNGILISYAAEDEMWKDQLVPQIFAVKPTWAKCHIIPAGQRWGDQTLHAIDKSQVAILLVSAELLASDFVQKRVIPYLIERRTLMIPVIVRWCLWRLVPWLEGRHVWPRGGYPLSSVGQVQRDKDWMEVTEEVLNLMGFASRV